MINPSSIYEKLVSAGDKWADDYAVAELFEETKKTLLAQLMRESGEKTQSAKEMEAMGNPKYIGHIEKMVDARKEANKSKVLYEAAKTYAELLRTKESSERAANRNAT